MSKSKNIKSSLGRGLDALITTDYSGVAPEGTSSINEIALSDITPNPGKCSRSDFDDDTLRSFRNLSSI